METTDLIIPQHKHYLRHVRHKTHHYDQLLSAENDKAQKEKSLSATTTTTIEADTSTVPFRIQNSKEGTRRAKPRHLMLTKPYWPWP
uniref:Uncharacterized protein n=1 Tax=Ditylenchus dipsaci TaxID=166011 RepID=A0A915D2U1_9BILA